MTEKDTHRSPQYKKGSRLFDFPTCDHHQLLDDDRPLICVGPVPNNSVTKNGKNLSNSRRICLRLKFLNSRHKSRSLEPNTQTTHNFTADCNSLFKGKPRLNNSGNASAFFHFLDRK